MPYVAGFVAWPSAGSNLTRENVGAFTESSGEAKHAANELLKGRMRQTTITIDPGERRIDLDRCLRGCGLRLLNKVHGLPWKTWLNRFEKTTWLFHVAPASLGKVIVYVGVALAVVAVVLVPVPLLVVFCGWLRGMALCGVHIHA